MSIRTICLVTAIAAGAVWLAAGPSWREAEHEKQGTVMKTDQEWKETLTAEQYRILRQKATERPQTGEYLHHKEDGTYVCAGCGNPLFVSDAKYDSGCGWPAFTEPAKASAVNEEEDRSFGMLRTEVLCSGCQGHLGHVFNDGPGPTGLRYCINSGALGFEPAARTGEQAAAAVATFGAGCFWCVEAAFEIMDGVTSAVSGYAGGTTPNPTYEQVCSKTTGHAEVVQVHFDPETVSFEKLLEMFFKLHDPTTPNRQGSDVGSQYRSIILYHDDAQKQAAEEMIRRLSAEKIFDDPIVTEVKPLETFYKAEKYHQDYFERNTSQPYCQMVIKPKLKKLGAR